MHTYRQKTRLRFITMFLIMIVLLASGCTPPQTPPPEMESAPPPANTVPASSDSTPAVQEADAYAAFRQGLIQVARGTPDQLHGASIYHIDLQIPEDFITLSGHQRVTYTNQEEATLDTLYFQLFPNAAGGKATVSALTVNGQTVYPLYELQDTALSVPLPHPLEPGEQAEVELDFQVRLPEEMGGNYGLLGYFEEILTLDTFYPMIPVYDDEGWNVEVPPSNGDWTYLDASFYTVRVTAPANLKFAASGTQIGHEQLGSTQVITFAAGPARDFYLAASEHYTVVSETVGETTVNSYALPGGAAHAQRILEVAADSLRVFNGHFGPYPYTEYDIAAIPMQAGGIEYPGIVGLTLTLYDPEATLWGLPTAIAAETTTAHETAHQWFYNMVGNDQIDEPWLDEAMAQYATGLYYEDLHGDIAAREYRSSWDARWSLLDRAEIPIGLPSAAYAENAYSPIVYNRGPIFITALAEEMGAASFENFLRAYCEQHRWEIGTATSFKQLAEEQCQCDLTPLFEAWVYETEQD